MIRGWLRRSHHGVAGMVPVSRNLVLAGRTSRSESASESVGSEVLDGAGAIGDAIGMAVMQLLAAAGITRGATRFITAAPFTEVEVSTAVGPCGAGLLTEVEVSTAVEARAAVVSARGPLLSTATTGQPGDTLRPAASGTRSGAFSGFSRGGQARSFSSRGKGQLRWRRISRRRWISWRRRRTWRWASLIEVLLCSERSVL